MSVKKSTTPLQNVTSFLSSQMAFLKARNLDGILLFFILLLVSHFIWKFGIENTIINNWLKPVYTFLIQADVVLTKIILELFSIEVSSEGAIMNFPDRDGILVTPLCSGLLHIFEITFILLFYKRFQINKLWYIPLSIFVIYVAASLHLVILSLFMIYKPESFSWAHNHLSRWVFFSFFFGIWYIWEEHFQNKSS
jgi:exosortase/archaeosortase family protein